MITLHLYLARELLKTFALTAVALTLLLVMGGGVANIFKGEGLAADDMAKVFLFLTPVAITLILPVAALFAATITYGRAASDNEITACRAAGINIHRLLLSAGLLGLLVTLVTYWAWNYMIPSLSRQIEELTKRDLPSIVVQQFQKAKPLIFGRHRIMATHCEIAKPADSATSDPYHTYLWLTGVSFVEMEDEEIMRFGTAEETVIEFDTSNNSPRVSVNLEGVRLFDAGRRQYYDLASQSLPPFDIPLSMRRKTKFETLGNLLEYQTKPQLSPEVEDRLYGLTREMMTYYMYQYVVDQLREHGSFRLVGPTVQYDIYSKEGSQDPDDGRPLMRVVRVEETGPAGKLIYTSESATIELRSSLDRMHPNIQVELIGNAEIRNAAESAADRAVHKPKEPLKLVPFMDQEGLRRQAMAFDTTSLTNGEIPHGLPKRQTKQCEKFLEFLRKFKAEVQGEIHFRASYSITSMAVVLMGAILGIIVRGGQVLTAFGISCIPSLIVVLTSIVGRNLSDRPGMSVASLCVMWGGAAVIYMATGLIAMKFLKR